MYFGSRFGQPAHIILTTLPSCQTFVMPGQERDNTSSIESRRGAMPIRKIGTRQYDGDGTGPWGG